jgi:hypothetical protein
MAKKEDSALAVATEAKDSGISQEILEVAPMLSKQSEILDIALAEDSTELDLGMFTRVKTPTGNLPKNLKFRIESELEDVETETIDGVIACYGSRLTLFKSYDPVKGEKPVLVAGAPAGKSMQLGYLTTDFDSMDWGELDPAEFKKCEVIDDEGRTAYRLDTLLYNQWDTGFRGIGKRANESRVFFMLTKHESFPIWLSAGPGSLGVVTKFLKGIGFKQAIDFRRLVYSIGLEKVANKSGTDFARWTISTKKGADGKAIMLTKEQATTIAEMYGKPIEIALEKSLNYGGSSIDVNDGGLE